MYRPQFAYPTPPDCRDEAFSYYFDDSNTPALLIGNGATINGIVLQTQNDAPFFWHAIKFNNPSSNLQPFIRLRDAFGNYLMNDYIDANLIAFPSFIKQIGALPITREPELYCPAGSVILLDVQNTQGAAGNLEVTMLGVKRYPKNPSFGRCV